MNWRSLSELGTDRGPEFFLSSHERLRGFREVLGEYGVSLEADYIAEGGYTFDSGVECARRLLALENRPTAIFAGNDEMAIGIYQAAREAGLRIPEDLSVVSFDDTPIASRVWPMLTTVRLPIREMGQAAASLILERSAESKSGPYISFTPELIVRQSTAPPP